ncbi:hypothetical protein ACFQ3Z_26555 [Streptomyces nogalater]
MNDALKQAEVTGRKADAALAQARRDKEEADELLEQAHIEAETRQERSEKLTKKLPTFALFAAIGLTASGEWSLAVLVGFPLLVAPLLPIAIDVYVIAAFRRHRDTFTAISLMVIANVLVHLAEAGLFGVTGTGDNVRPTWWLVALVVSIGPFVLWRVHALRDHPATAAAPAAPRRRRNRRHRSRPRRHRLLCRPVPAPAPAPVTRPVKARLPVAVTPHRLPVLRAVTAAVTPPGLQPVTPPPLPAVPRRPASPVRRPVAASAVPNAGPRATPVAVRRAVPGGRSCAMRCANGSPLCSPTARRRRLPSSAASSARTRSGSATRSAR